MTSSSWGRLSSFSITKPFILLTSYMLTVGKIECVQVRTLACAIRTPSDRKADIFLDLAARPWPPLRVHVNGDLLVIYGWLYPTPGSKTSKHTETTRKYYLVGLVYRWHFTMVHLWQEGLNQDLNSVNRLCEHDLTIRIFPFLDLKYYLTAKIL